MKGLRVAKILKKKKKKKKLFELGTIIRRGITCKKIRCDIGESASMLFIVEKLKCFEVTLTLRTCTIF